MTLTQRYRSIYKPLIWIAALAPLLWMVAGIVGVLGFSMGADPVKAVIHHTGKTALNLLGITLAVTPLARLGRWPQLIRLRRLLGLWAFAYALLHFTLYLGLDLRFDFAHLGADIVKRPYITIGFAAILLLLPLAATSTQRMMRRLGRRWQSLHRAIYAIGILAVWHFYWQVKADIREPLWYAAGLALLLGVRLWWRAAARRATSRSESAIAPGKT